MIIMSNNKWTDQEIADLTLQSKDTSLKQIAMSLGKSYSTVLNKAKSLGLQVNSFKRNDYTQEETQVIIKHFEWAPKQFIEDLLPNRQWSSIIRYGHRLGLRRLSQDKISLKYDFFSDWTEKSAYIFGFILADGYIHKGADQNVLQIEVASHDQDILYKIAQALDFKGKLYIRPKSIKFQTHNIKIIDDLHSKGIPLFDKSHTAKWPDNIPDDMVRHVIRGLVDGDGWSRIDSDGSYNFGICGTYELVSAVKDHLYYDCSNNKIRQQGPGCYRFNIKGEKGIKLAQWLYEDSTIYLDRKFNIYKEVSEREFPRRRSNPARTRSETQ